MRRRSRGQEPWPLRLVLRCEAPLLRRYERRIVRRAAAQLVISDSDAAALPAEPPPVVLPNAVAVSERVAEQERDIDVMLHRQHALPTERGCGALADPRDRAGDQAPQAADVVRDRRALRGPARRARLDAGAQRRAEPRGLPRRARTAVVPLRLGTGAPNKVLEAIAAGAVIVGTSARAGPVQPASRRRGRGGHDGGAGRRRGRPAGDPAGLEARREAGVGAANAVHARSAADSARADHRRGRRIRRPRASLERGRLTEVGGRYWERPLRRSSSPVPRSARLMSTTMPTSRPVKGRFPLVAAGLVAPASLLGAAPSLGVGARGRLCPRRSPRRRARHCRPAARCSSRRSRHTRGQGSGRAQGRPSHPSQRVRPPAPPRPSY